MESHLPTILFLAEAGGGKEGAHHSPSFAGMMVYIVLTFGLIFGLMAYAKPGLKQRVFKNPITSALEQVYLFVEGMCVNIIGAHGRRYVPIITGFWLIIFSANLIALFFPYSVTTDIGFNLGMALVSIGYVQWEGMKANGVVGHFKHFAGPKLGGAMVIISGMIFLIEIISETMKNVSLSLRLYGNIEGGHLVTDALNGIGKLIPFRDGYIGFPFGALLLPLKLMTVVVQALIFTLLTCVYLSLVTHHDHGDEEHAH